MPGADRSTLSFMCFLSLKKNQKNQKKIAVLHFLIGRLGAEVVVGRYRVDTLSLGRAFRWLGCIDCARLG